MEKFSKSSISTFDTWLKESKSIVAVTHQSPDGDAVGSLLAFKRILSNMGKEVVAVLPDPVPDFLTWITEGEDCLVWEKDKEKSAEKFKNADLIVVLDYNEASRAGDGIKAPYLESPAKKVMFDHHPFPNEEDFDLLFSDIKACATAEVLGNWLIESGKTSFLDKGVAEALYLGLITDSGSFRFPSVRAETHELASMLLKTGLSHAQIHEKVFDQNSLSRLRLVGYALSNKLNILKEFNVAYISLEETELFKFHAIKGDTEGLVNYALSIKGIDMAVFFKQQEGIIKLSFRSIGERKVNELAKKHFHGGGHNNAAGGRYEGTMEDAIGYFKKVMKDESY